MMRETVSTIADDEECQTCNKTYAWHLENNPMHPFNSGQTGATAFLGDRRARGDRSDGKTPQRGVQGAPRAAMPIDPVLRQALVDKGVLTPQDLRDAEEKIHAITGLFNQGSSVMRGGPNGQ
jgi:hypothetical protein